MSEEVLEELVALVHAHRRERLAALSARADTEVAALVAEAHREARGVVHRHVVELRQTLRARVGRAEAALETARRRHAQRRDLALLAAAWPLLAAALVARWRDAGARRRWVEGIVASARDSLPEGCWSIHHPGDWPADERDALLDGLQAPLGARPLAFADQALSAGLRINVDRTCLDGSLEGMLADRSAIESLLLAEFER